MTADVSAPLDREHEESLRQVRIIRAEVDALRERVARWQPTMCPPKDGTP